MRDCAGAAIVAALCSLSTAAADECPGGAFGYVVTVQGIVEISAAGSSGWQPAQLDTLVCEGDLIRVGERSRAGIYFDDIETVTYVDQNTTTGVAARPAERSLILDLLEGALNFLSREPRSLEIRTPFVNAGVKGTEFEVRVELDRPASERPGEPFSGRTVVTLVEGRVEARVAQETKILVSGQSGEARGHCPSGLSLDRLQGGPTCVVPEGLQALRVYARLPDTVQWALYYPPITAGGPAALTPELAEASRLLARGRVDEALPILCAGPAQGEKSALLAIVELTRNDPLRRSTMVDACGRPSQRDDRQRALDLAEQAVRMSPRSAAAWIALSYARQAYAKLEDARAALEQAVAVDPNDALARARLAEIWLSLGYRDRALEEAERARNLSPSLSRTQTVYGFAALAEIDLDRARSAFTRAIEAESADPLPWLGRGLARIRDGDLAAGRRELEIAAGLDPQNALIRSYLGKAYFEEKRRPLDATQFDLAKKLDPEDPTPWLYDAIRLETENRPVEALQAIHKSIELNDNRAVYRSRLSLDEDAATRSVQLGRIYRDIGFDQLALVEGWKSLQLDPSSFSAHRLLADNYLLLPRHEIATDSELLQSQLLQPININPVQPRLADNGLSFLNDVGPNGVGFNEFTRLYARDQLRFQVDGIVGSSSTYADNAILSGISSDFSYSVGQFHFRSDGTRPNNDLEQNIYNAFAQASLADSTTVQIEFRSLDEDLGDRRLFFDPTFFFPTERRRIEERQGRVGLRHDFAPNSTLIASYSFGTREETLDDPAIGLAIDAEDRGHLAEARYIHQFDQWNVSAGAGVFLGDVQQDVTIFPSMPETSKADIEHENFYVYADLHHVEDVVLTLGFSGDFFEDLGVKRTQLNPKIGVTWEIDPQTTFRAAVMRVLKRTLTSSQTIERTNVAGFNQFFDDPNGTDSWRYAIALDRKFSSRLYGGLEISKRDLSVPVASDPGTTFDEEEDLGRVYVYWTPTDWLAAGAEYRFERVVRDPTASNAEALVDTTIHRVPIEFRVFDGSGWFGSVRTTFIRQEGHFQSLAGPIFHGKDSFWTLDASLGYRFENQLGLAAIEVRNLLDEEFKFQDSDPENQTVAADRTILGRLTLAF